MYRAQLNHDGINSIETKNPAKVIEMLRIYSESNDLLIPKLKDDGKHVISEEDECELLTPNSFREYQKISETKYYCCGTIILTC